jgi:hypothetical protein
MTSIFTAVTPDNKETEIGKIKVVMTEDISAAELAIVQKWQPAFQPKSEMYRLELIDEDILKLQKAVNDAQAALDAKIALRAKVEEAALKVELAI